MTTDNQIGYWGAGFIGLSGSIAFLWAGRQVVTYDTDADVIARLQSGECHLPGFERFIGWTLRDALTKDWLPTSDPSRVLACHTQIIAVPTERDGQPNMGIVRKVAELVFAAIPHGGTLSIESTLTPGEHRHLAAMATAMGHRLGESLHLVIAPRRDWFGDPPRHLDEIPRVVGGVTLACQEAARRLYATICPELHVTDASIAEAVKVVENALLYVPVTLGFDLATGMDVDVNEVLRLAGTHWRIPTYHLSAGVGGYCVANSATYLLDACDTLQMPAAALATERDYRRVVECTLARTIGAPTRVLILGASYKPGYKVLAASPVFGIARMLVRYGHTVRVLDPLVSDEELRAHGLEPHTTDGEPYGGVVFLTAHPAFEGIMELLGERTKEGAVFCDCVGTWQGRCPAPLRYWRLGAAGWRDGLSSAEPRERRQQ